MNDLAQAIDLSLVLHKKEKATLFNNVNNSLRKYSKKKFVTKYTHNKCDSYNKTKKKRTIAKRSN